MTLVLNVVGSVSPTESSADRGFLVSYHIKKTCDGANTPVQAPAFDLESPDTALWLPTAPLSLLHCEGLNNQSYSCESGHCCGESRCCSYYYELWWFWLVWAIIIILSCCCICHHRRTKHRLQQQQRQHEINLMAYREANNYTPVPFYFRFLPNYLLPDYEEVVNRPPTPPPPYSALHTVSSTVPSSPLSGEQQEGHCHTVQSTPAVPVSDALCPRPSLEEADPGSVGFLPKLDNKSPHMAQDLGTITRSDGVLLDGLAGEGRASSEKWERGTGDPCKEPLLEDPGDLEGSAEEKRLLPTAGRRRQFTGDSGIEVCVCGGVGGGSSGAGVQEDGELKELESLLGCTEEEEAEGGGEFCESCGPCGHLSEDEEQAQDGPERVLAQDGPERVLDQEPSAEPQPTHQTTSSSSSSSSGSSNAPPMCALNEQEGPHHGTKPQG
ncbi:WW domain binding protein 1-like [Merluccius polli]|uniref:WW domain binding protein 1-like n=1 Tax=Merluccius polli TaxID=89951 RepID=A0AA47N2G0_MERPO|nr:WW domain binding protein 1-like [Merluccius polli]